MLGGCAEDGEPTPRDRLIGVWGLQLNKDCAVGYLFGADSEYEYRVGCYSDGGFDLEIYSGKWDADADRLQLEPEGGTCPTEHAAGAATPSSFRYALRDDDQTLNTIDAEGVISFERLDDDGMPSGGGAVYTFGCFTPDGFEPRVFERY